MAKEQDKRSQSNHPPQYVIRIPKELIPLWDSIKQDVTRNIKKQGQEVANSLVLQKVLTEFSKRDYYLLNSSIENLGKIVEVLQSRIDNFETMLNRITIKISTGGIL
jgi:pantothenate kinase